MNRRYPKTGASTIWRQTGRRCAAVSVTGNLTSTAWLLGTGPHTGAHQQFPEGAFHPGLTFACVEVDRIRPRGDHEVAAGREIMFDPGHRLAQHAFDAVACDGVADLLGNRQTHPWRVERCFARKHVDNEFTAARRPPLTVDAIEIAAA